MSGRAATLGALDSLDRWPLSPRIWTLVRTGDHDGRYNTRSEVAAAVVAACVRASWSYEQTHALFDDPENAVHGWLTSDYKGRPRHQRESLRQFDRLWAKEQAFIRNEVSVRSRGEVAEHLASVLAAVQEAEGLGWFLGRGGPTDLKVLRAHIDLVAQYLRVQHYAAARTMANMTGVRAQTVSASHKRLMGAGWLRRASGRRGQMADRWTVTVPSEVSLIEGPALDSVTSLCAGYFRARPHDVWRAGGGLGATKALYYEWLSAEAQSVSELAEHFRCSARNVRLHLAVLATHGLALKQPEGWVRGEADLDPVARALGVLGTGHHQEVKYEAEGEAYRQFLARPRKVHQARRDAEDSTIVSTMDVEYIVAARARHRELATGG